MTENEYEELEKKAEILMKNTLDPQHDFSHIRRVTKNALKIVDVLSLENSVDKDILKIACLFHDITFIQQRPSLTTWIFEGKFATRILRELDLLSFLNKKDFSLVEQAILYHGLAFPLRRLNRKRNLYCQILQDADMLDQFHPDRIKNFEKSKTNSVFSKAIYIFRNPVSKFGIKNIRFFLNFPQLAKIFHK
jgi:CRISPR/Cas system-associated endonuclease Cas3-HD